MRGITQKQRDNLEKDRTILEVQRAIRNMVANKATGPDGIPAEFYNQFEYLILERLHAVLTEAAERGWLDENMREGDIILLYKKVTREREARNYRPIILL